MGFETQEQAEKWAENMEFRADQKREERLLAPLTPPSVVYADHVRYERVPSLDKRIKNGDDFAGDAWVRHVAVGRAPDDLLAQHAAKLTRERAKLIEALRLAADDLLDGDYETRAGYVTEIRALLRELGEL